MTGRGTALRNPRQPRRERVAGPMAVRRRRRLRWLDTRCSTSGMLAVVAGILIAGVGWWAEVRLPHQQPPIAPPALVAIGGAQNTTGPTTESGHSSQESDDAAVAVEQPTRQADQRPRTSRLRPIGWYQLASVEYGINAQMLEALHVVETGGSGDACVANLEGSGATGPFQFKPPTFARFGVDGNHDGLVDICGFTDSLFSAAHYLRELGADADPGSAASRRALARYGTDVELVMSLTRTYQDSDRY